MKIFQRLIEENAEIWDAYVHHKFVKELEKGSLPRENFLFYLKQDYIYLHNYARCYALLANNASNAKELRLAMKCQNYIMDGELELHRSILELGINADKLGVRDESLVNLAYTRYMLDVANSGDYVDMLAALCSCFLGYGVIGKEIYDRLGEAGLKDHPYEQWIRTYSEANFQAECTSYEEFIDGYAPIINEAKFKKMSDIFHTVTRLECAFWQHGLDMKLDL
ncbi:thiaminase II [Campylobacter troglodytis]|uniref:thiaminase II n=1 Tax=Campylobacter troglodytis TaxID=654363 RepID=UPI00115A5EEA|nr:thiaminase II [Campylobacter troglodytis]TQR61263.1 thiaminase II [Campylobacter troglodytis]